jgi:hypothetical protein
MAQDSSSRLFAFTRTEELFERERETHPDLNIWEGCVQACESASEKRWSHAIRSLRSVPILRKSQAPYIHLHPRSAI